MFTAASRAGLVLLVVLAAGPIEAQSAQDILRRLGVKTILGTGIPQARIPNPGTRIPQVVVPNPGGQAVDVARMQLLLNRAGYDAGAPDGMLGPATVRAAARFQQSLGNSPTGYLTPGEMRALEKRAGQANVAAAVRSPDPKELQRLLTEAGFDPGGIDGRWGKRSQRALQEFRRSAGMSHAGPPNGTDLAALQARVGTETLLTVAAAPAQIEFATRGEDGKSLTALPVADKASRIRVAWDGPGAGRYWLAVIEPGAMPGPNIPAWSQGPTSPTTITAPDLPGLYEIALIDIRSGQVFVRRALEVR